MKACRQDLEVLLEHAHFHELDQIPAESFLCGDTQVAGRNT
jgi:hypothetical protein